METKNKKNMDNSPLVFGYYHICTINNYLEIVSEQLTTLQKSGLLARTTTLFLTVLNIYSHPEEITGPLAIPQPLLDLLEKFSPSNELPEEGSSDRSPDGGLSEGQSKNNKIVIRMINRGSLYELETMNTIRLDAIEFLKERDELSDKDYLVYYFHSKGVSDKIQKDQNLQRNVRDWRLLMEEVILWNWEACLKAIWEESYDIAGCNYYDRKPNDWPMVSEHFHGNYWFSHAKYLANLRELSLFDHYLMGEMWLGSGNPSVYEFFSTGINHYLEPYSPIPDLTSYGLLKRSVPHVVVSSDRPIRPGQRIRGVNGAARYLSLQYLIDNSNMYILATEINQIMREKNYSTIPVKHLPIFYEIKKNYQIIRAQITIFSFGEWSRCLVHYLTDLFVCCYYSERKSAREIAEYCLHLASTEWQFYQNFRPIQDQCLNNFRHLGVDLCSIKHLTIEEKQRNGYNIVIVNDSEFPRSVFADIDQQILTALPNSQINSRIVLDRINIILCGHASSYRGMTEGDLNIFPADSILLNMEQLDNTSDNPEQRRVIERYFPILGKYPIIDYDPNNREIIRRKFLFEGPIISSPGLPKGKETGLLEFGFLPQFHFVKKYDEVQHDIDVLFFGDGNPKRDILKEKLSNILIHKDGIERKAVVMFVNKVFRDERIDLLRRSRIVLNIRGHGNCFQISRIGFLLNNSRFVISEDLSKDPSFDASLSESPHHYYADLLSGMITVPFDKMADTVSLMLGQPEERTRIAELGAELYRRRQPKLILPPA